MTEQDKQRALDWFNKSLESPYPPEPNKDEYDNCVRCIREALTPAPVDEEVREAIKDFREAFDWLVDNGDDHRSLPDARAALGTIFEAGEILINAAKPRKRFTREELIDLMRPIIQDSILSTHTESYDCATSVINALIEAGAVEVE